MKRFLISEIERKQILRSHGIISEAAVSTQDATAKLREIQQGLGVRSDVIIGPETTGAIVSALGTQSQSQSSSSFKCVTDLYGDQVVTITKTDGTKEDDNVELLYNEWESSERTYGQWKQVESTKTSWQIGELVFEKDGKYFDLNNPNQNLTYTCSGKVIKTESHGEIEPSANQDVKIEDKVDVDSIKLEIKRLKREEERTDEEIVKELSKTYTEEQILSADMSFKPIFDKMKEKTKSTEPEEKKPEETKDLETAIETKTFDENSIVALGTTIMDKMGTRPAGLDNLNK